MTLNTVWERQNSLNLPFSEACERNQRPIWEILQNVLSNSKHVLEIGSGSGQHAVYFGRKLNHLSWQTSDLEGNIAQINARLEFEGTDNIIAPLTLDVTQSNWPKINVDAVFIANVFHISPWEVTEQTFKRIKNILNNPGKVCIYGPFSYKGNFTSESNDRFDKSLKNTDPSWGIRDFKQVDALAEEIGLKLEADHFMPANNQLLIWRTL